MLVPFYFVLCTCGTIELLLHSLHSRLTLQGQADYDNMRVISVPETLEWHHLFIGICLKQFYMPNSANRNAGGNNASKGQPKHDVGHDNKPKANDERSDRKHGDHPKESRGDTSRSSNQGRKEASGGTVED